MTGCGSLLSRRAGSPRGTPLSAASWTNCSRGTAIPAGGVHYAAERPNRDTLAFFCHFGLSGVLLSHLFHLSPVALLQHYAAAPTSVTTVYTEEREQGIAQFRCAGYGDVSHLYAAHEPPSFSARFCETFDSAGERH